MFLVAGKSCISIANGARSKSNRQIAVAWPRRKEFAMIQRTKIAALSSGLLISSVAGANLLANGSFESPAGYALGQQGILPVEWNVTNVTPDMYSSDASFGLNPNVLGNFTGVTAQDGLGWVAGWSSFAESFAQNLGTALTPGTSYSLSGYLRQAKRSDLDNPGAYNIFLNSTNTMAGAQQVASWSPTTGANFWEFRSTSFVAPANASLLPWIIFEPYESGPGSAYPGLDNVILTPVPEPATIAALGAGALAILRRRR